MEEEIWKELPGYEGFYEVSNLGRVKSFKRYKKGKVLNLSKNDSGYLRVGLRKNNKCKTKKVHQLVAIAFLNHTPCGYKIVIDHIDNDPLNNRLDNLQLITQRENSSKDRSTEVTGVRKQGENFIARIKINGKLLHLGMFPNIEEASLYYKNAVKSIENNTEIVIKKPKWTSKYKGVYWHKLHNKWAISIKSKHLGYFNTEKEAYERVKSHFKSLHLQQI